MITQERAIEIYNAGLKYSNWSDHMTEDEKRFVNEIWRHMPGYTCFYDALMRIVKGTIPKQKYPEGAKVGFRGRFARYPSNKAVVEDFTADGLYLVRLSNGNPAWCREDQLSPL